MQTSLIGRKAKFKLASEETPSGARLPERLIRELREREARGFVYTIAALEYVDRAHWRVLLEDPEGNILSSATGGIVLEPLADRRDT